MKKLLSVIALCGCAALFSACGSTESNSISQQATSAQQEQKPEATTISDTKDDKAVSEETIAFIYTVTPAEHYTGRNPLKNNATLWGGLYIKDGTHNFYYTGDTGYYDLFEQVYDKLGAPDLMLADSGQYDKGWATTHMFPEETVQAARDAHAKWLIPVHWGAYSLSNHAWRRIV